MDGTENREADLGRSEGELYLVATPIGNLEDISARALRVLNQVQIIAAEDTRHTRRLLSYFQINKPLISVHKENERYQTEKIINLLMAGKKIALVSDAGMPGISDPGAYLVKEAVEQGIQVIPIPGPSALILALAASALPTERFVFEGFLRRKGKERRAELAMLAQESRTIILYEAPHRIRETLRDLEEYFGGDRLIVISRELTKVYEEFWRGTIGEALAEWEERTIKGEFTLVIQGKPEDLEEVEDITEIYRRLYPELLERVSKGEKASTVIREVARREELSRHGLYQWFLEQEH
jgi:16S rRNA (cytidine1402-2'-O)-methyltransferase